MGKLTFKGGVHPFDGKEFSKDKPIKELLPEGDMVFPLSQHIGAPAVPVVAKGDHVLAGQLIAEAGGFISANIHSSVSGTVKAIEPRTLATGGKCNSIIIENDGKYEEVEYVKTKFEDLTNDMIREKVKAAGDGIGFNAAENKYEDMMKAGIVDPAKVTRSALQNAASIAALVLTTEAVVGEIPEDKPAMPPMPQGGMM